MKIPFGKERCEVLAQYVNETGATVRATASVFGISKSTVHKDLTERLRFVNHALYLQVKNVLKRNKAERHRRGGEATKQMYLRRKRGK